MSIKETKKFRDVVYGFVELDDQEWEIVNHPAFQRLRRIKQLSLTDYVYPGANHTRFEHSIGVVQMASDMFDCIFHKNKSLLSSEFGMDDVAYKRFRKIVRLAALLHDVGHPPFSHAGEDLMPFRSDKKTRYEHEDYSIAIIKKIFRSLIEDHPSYRSYAIKAEEVTTLLGDSRESNFSNGILLWKDIISGQVDADRADYLLRDSIHLGVNYGLYDRNRLINCMTLGTLEDGYLTTAIEEKGWHIAESIVLARYQMFLQVYFHKTRRIFDYHILHATKQVLQNFGEENAVYPSPERIDDYLRYDDWKVQGAISAGLGGKHGEIILNRNHYRKKFETQLIPTKEDEKELRILSKRYPNHFIDKVKGTWYKLDKDIWIKNTETGFMTPLSVKSSIVNAMNESHRIRFYAEV